MSAAWVTPTACAEARVSMERIYSAVRAVAVADRPPAFANVCGAIGEVDAFIARAEHDHVVAAGRHPLTKDEARWFAAYDDAEDRQLSAADALWDANRSVFGVEMDRFVMPRRTQRLLDRRRKASGPVVVTARASTFDGNGRVCGIDFDHSLSLIEDLPGQRRLMECTGCHERLIVDRDGVRHPVTVTA